MDLNLPISLRIVFFLLGMMTINTSGQICSALSTVTFNENNTLGAVVTTIMTEPGVTLEITENPNDTFGLNDTLLVANKVLDYEILPEGGLLRVSILCTNGAENTRTITIYVVVLNINDNPPVFAYDLYRVELDELSKVGTSVTTIEATDLDLDPLYYWLESPMDEFRLKAINQPEILVNKVLDYDTTKDVTLKLCAQDTALSSEEKPSHTATTTVIVVIVDINDRPPQFEPCTESVFGTTKICVNSGYTGNVNLNQQTTGPLTLKPGPVYAIDGDKGRNDPIGYRIVGDDLYGTFAINPNTANITMNKPVSIHGPILLTVMAYELDSPDRFTTTTVLLQVVISSDYPPVFVKPEYEGFISEDARVGSLVLESKFTNIPLRVEATDQDFSDGVNPSIQFEIPESIDFKITQEGFIIMARAASPGIVQLQMLVVDSTNLESGTAFLTVEVTPGFITTDVPTTTSGPITTAINTTMAISTDITTSMNPDTTTVTVTQLTASITPNLETTNRNCTERLPMPAGKFRTVDMVALGLSLAIALLICLAVIGVLAVNLKRYSSDWRKLSEASIFRSSLSGGSGGPKDGVQYTNEGFHANDDTDSVSSKQAAEMALPRGPNPNLRGLETMETQSSNPTSLPPDSSSQKTLDSTDNDKEVKPILTKERRMEDGYKAVWFKEDIDPNDKQEVVISDREQDIDDEDDDYEENYEEEEEEDEREDEEEKDSNFAQL